MSIRMLGLAIVTAALLPELAAAQAPPVSKAPRPAATPSQSTECANPTPPATTGQDVDVSKPDGSNLSQKLAQSNGVLCPPEHVDPQMRAPTPPGGRMPVIKPPGSPGSPDQSVQPK
ncbi:MAG TPA: hypothetical protein VIJ67_08035 [Pseudolabrys sp.]|jgi:hypothetical protein